MMSEKEILAVLQLGARTILAAGDAGPFLAKAYGVDLQPGEDLLAGMAREKNVSRAQMQAYFEALADGVDVEEAHMRAQLAVMPVN